MEKAYNRVVTMLMAMFIGFFKGFCLIFAIGVVIVCYIGLKYYGVALNDIFKFIYFQLIHVYLPGALLRRILNINKGTVENISYSYALGIIFTILEYFFLYSINKQDSFMIIGPVLSIMELVLFINMLFKSREREQVTDRSIPIVLLFITALLMLITFVGFTIANPLPYQTGMVTYNPDFLWTIGNTQAIIRGLPPMDARMSGIVFNYHYFLSVHLAVMSIVSKLGTVEVFFWFSQIGKVFLMVFSSYVLGKAYFNNRKKALFFSWVFFFSNCASLYGAYKINYGIFLNFNFSHVTDYPFGYELSISFLFLCAAIIIDQIKCNKLHYGYLIAGGLFTFGATGSKGPLGAMIFGVLVVVLIILIVQRKEYKLVAPYMYVTAFGYLIVFFTLLNRGGELLDISPGFTVSASILGKVLKKLGNENNMKYLRVAFIPIHFVLYLPFAAIPFLEWFFNKLRHIKTTRAEEFLIGGMALSGILASYLLKHTGSSHMYFIMASTAFIEICAIDWLAANFKRADWLIKLIIIGGFAAGTITTYYMTMFEYNKAMVKVEQIKSKSLMYANPYFDRITRYEYEGMKWLDNNTDINSIIATDRHFIGKQQTEAFSRSFYYSAFSNRQVFLEGWLYTYPSKEIQDIIKHKYEINSKLFSKKEENRSKIMRENGIDYLVLSRVTDSDIKIDEKNLVCVFSNRDLRIYKLK
ncbi:MAG: hypothetical protein K0R09_3658 [Clostridiales bacterium]|jgi:hypothetical protein|nr:hypothetical protein [Clostridiales bacterium]